jgi:PAS domain S-box-containing protein
MSATRFRDSRRPLLAIGAALISAAAIAVAAIKLPFPAFAGLLYFVGLAGAGVLVLRFKRLQRETAASVQQLADVKSAIDHAAIVATTDVTGRITYVNDKFCEISQYSREELIGQDHRIINSGHHPRAFIRDLWRTIAAGLVWHGELRNKAKDGSYYWVDTTIVPFLNARGKPYQYIAIRADITARKAAERRLAEQAALARVGQMAAVVAHEVRNPLAGIKGAIQVLISRRSAGDAELPVMRDVVSRIDALGDLINDLMVYARPKPPRPTEFSLHHLLMEAVLMLRRDPAGAGVDVGVEDRDVTVVADAELIRGTVLNLLLNAGQAMNGTGRIGITISVHDDRCAVDIRDTGPGIAPELRERVFEPFFTTKARGGGLGLSIAQRTAELHGGSLKLTCPDGGGSQFTLTLPLRPVVRPASGASEGVPDEREHPAPHEHHEPGHERYAADQLEPERRASPHR